MSTTTSGDDPVFPEVSLHTIRNAGRSVAYSIAGDRNSDATPVLFFYPGGANRLMVQSLHETAVQAHLKVISVNRPGKAGTSPAIQPGAAAHLKIAVEDATLVLDELGIQRVALLFMCAGTPFALGFATMKSERTSRILGVASWVLPADCGYANTKFWFYMGTHTFVPRWFVAPLAGSVFRSIGSSMSFLPPGWVQGALRSKLSSSEKDAFDAKFNKDEFAKGLSWMKQEKGGEAADVDVLLSKGSDLGIDYQQIGQTHCVVLCHGTKDKLVPYASIEWMKEQIPSAMLNTLPDGSHEGAEFLLHESVIDSIASLRHDDGSDAKQ